MNHADFAETYLAGNGVEIGASDSPIEGISPIYVDKFKEYAGKPCLADYPGEATALPFLDCSLDYVASSHVLEHLANPVKALVEWQRVLKPGGHAYTVVPDRRYTFDQARELTTPTHMIDDYINQVTDTDATHIDDFVFGIDWSTLTPDLPQEEVVEQQLANAKYHRAQSQAGHEINIHFHVFEPSNFLDLVRLANSADEVPLEMEIVEVAERFPDSFLNGFLVVLRKPVSATSCMRMIASKLRQLAKPVESYPIDPQRIGEFK